VALAVGHREPCLCYKNQYWQEMVKGDRFSFNFFLFLPYFKQNWKVSTNLSESFINDISQKSILGESACCVGKDRKERYGKAGSRVFLAKVRRK
jgi:hypothetical protein